MLINSEKPKNSSNHLIWLVIAIVILLGVKVLLNGNGGSMKGFLKGKEKAKEAPTKLSSTLYTENLLTDTINRVYKNDRLSLYLNNEMGMPTLMAVYKDSISELERNGRFLVFLYLKDPTEWRSINKKYDHILLTKEKIEPYTKTINKTNYFIFKFGLEHPYFDLKNLKELEFVRHTRAFGRFEEVQINSDSLPQPYPISNSLETIDIDLSQANYSKIGDKRDEALVSGVLMTADDDFVAAGKYRVEGKII